MKDSKFERELKQLLHYVREYGIDHILDRDATWNPIKNEQQKRVFLIQVHKGFKLAQNSLISHIQKAILDRKACSKELALERSKRKNERSSVAITELQSKVNHLKFQEYIFRSIADTIAWSIFKLDFSTIRRLSKGEEPIDITSSNFQSCILAADFFMNKDEANFALLNDLTSFVNIGDITLASGKDIGFIEVKEGAVNEEISNLIHSFSDNKCEYYLYNKLNEGGDKFKEQFFRYAKQIANGSSTLNIIRTGRGREPETGNQIHIHEFNTHIDYFDKTLNELVSKARIKGCEATVIDGCLLLGAYSTEKMSSAVFDIWAEAMKSDYLKYDMREGFFDPGLCPPFVLRLSSNDLVDIVMGKMVVKMSINIDEWLNQLVRIGGAYRWLSRRETSKINSEKKKNFKMIEVNGKGVEIIFDNNKINLYGGILSRIYSQLVTPFSALKMLKDLCSQTIDTLETQMRDDP